MYKELQIEIEIELQMISKDESVVKCSHFSEFCFFCAKISYEFEADDVVNGSLIAMRYMRTMIADHR